jgi:hypothetical protein
MFGTTLLIASHGTPALFTDHATIHEIRGQLRTILPRFPPRDASPPYSQPPEPPDCTIRRPKVVDSWQLVRAKPFMLTGITRRMQTA